MFPAKRNPVSHPMVRFGAMAILALMVGGLAACGGGSGGGAANPPKSLDAAKMPGAWINTSAGEHVYLLVEPSSTASFPAHVLGDAGLSMIAGTLNLAGSRVTGKGLAYASSSSPFPNGVTSAALTVGGTATAAPDTLSLGFAGNGQPLSSPQPFTPDAAANTPVALADLAGTYQAPATATSENQAVRVTINPPAAGAATTTFTGVIDPGGANAAFTGTISTRNGAPAGTNLFTVSMPVPDGQGASINVSGVAYLRSGTPPTLVVMTSTSVDPASTTAEQVSGIFTRLPN